MKPQLKKENRTVSHEKPLLKIIKSLFWFSVGALLGIFLLASFTFIFFQKKYHDVVYPGVMIYGINVSEKTEDEVRDFFLQKNKKIGNTKFVIYHKQMVATLSAQEIDYGYNANLLAKQAYSVGRSKDITTNISLVTQAYVNGINLPPSYTFSEEKLTKFLEPLIQKVTIPPVDALFTFQNGKVTAFQPSSDGQEVDIPTIRNDLSRKMVGIITSQKPKTYTIALPIKVVKPKVSTEQANDMGIKELIGTGTSQFEGSIENRIYNITLAATKINGILVAPNEVFSFNKVLGDVSKFTGFKQAYVIENGKTVLGDGGGVCQVSTTLFRAILNAGLPMVERHAHAYRVGYYEQDSAPGIDATIYVPGVDLRFKNDTGHHILIQSTIDPSVQQLTFMLYGTKDDRQVILTKPVISSQSPPPDPLYQDDPTLAKGTVKQVDFAAWGAHVTFSRTVIKDGEVYISETYTSRYRPWQAVYLRGTKG